MSLDSESPIGAVMTAFPHAVGADEPLAEAQRLMAKHSIRHLPVKAEGKLIGVLTDRDLKLALGPYSGWPEDGEAGPRVRHACLFDIYAVPMATPLREVVAEMARRRIGSALVTKDGRLAGIFTATDACRLLAEQLGGGEPPAADATA